MAKTQGKGLQGRPNKKLLSGQVLNLYFLTKFVKIKDDKLNMAILFSGKS